MVNFCEDFFCHDENCVGTKLDMFCLNVNKPLDTSIPFVSGKMLIEEQLREFYLNMAVNETDPTLWWKYMIEFDDRVCLETKDIKGCSIEAMEAVGVTKDQISSVDLFVA